MPSLRTWRHFPLLRDLALVALAFFAIRAYQHRNLPSGPAPALRATDLQGATVDLRDYRGKPVILHFWATWCGVCSAEQHNLDALAQAGLPVLSIASDSGPAPEVAAYVAEHRIQPRVVVDPSRTLSRRFAVSAFPTTFVLDADGNIAHVEVGYTTELGLRARYWLAGLGL